MAKRKIAECISVRINIGNYQHIELTKYAEEEMEFNSEKERIEKEDALRDDLVTSLVRSMKAIPERLGKGVEKAIEVEEAIKKVIPAWLENNPIPNIANGAKKVDLKNVSAQVANKAISQDNQKDAQKIAEPIQQEANIPQAAADSQATNPSTYKILLSPEDLQLFEDDKTPSRPIEDGGDLTTEEMKQAKVESKDDLDLFAEDDDIFGDK